MIDHRRRMPFAPLLAASVLAAALAAPGIAEAQKTVRSNQYSGFNRIDKGVIELGVHNMWILGHSSAGDAEGRTQMTLVSGLAGRYFIQPNVAVGVSGSALYKTLGGDDRDTGIVVTASASYALRLGNGMFLAPTLGGGGLFGTRTTPTGPSSNMSASLVGGVLELGLPLVFYAWDRFNLRAGLSFLVSFGSATVEGQEGESFSGVDGGFNVGFGYYF
jgi:hypothetical protein